MKNEIIIHSSSTNTLKLIILGGGIMMIGVFILDSTNILVQILGLLNGLLGLICVIFGFIALLHIKPKITLSDLVIKDSRILKEFVIWNEIDDVKLIYENGHNKLLVLLSKEVDYSKLTFLYKSFNSKKSDLIENRSKSMRGELRRINKLSERE